MFRTPNLHSFTVTWYLKPSQFPDNQPLGAEDFIVERFIEDIMDGNQSISLIVEQIRIPMNYDRTPGRDVAVKFEVITTEAIAHELVEIGYRVSPLHPDQMTTKWVYPGITWGELQRLLAHDIASGEVPADDEALFTDDEDGDAPWYRMRSIKKDDRGWFLALEIVE